MNPDLLRVFLAVRHAGSVKGAARALAVDHATVSRRLAALEESLGARLFERTSEGLAETDVARANAPLAEAVETLVHEIRDAARATSDSMAGPVRIAAAPLFAELFLLPRMPELMRRFPEVAFDVHADISRASLQKREADIAVRHHPAGKDPAEASARVRKVGQLGFAAYASVDYLAQRGRPTVPIRDLSGHHMIDSSAWGPAGQWNHSLDVPAPFALSVYPFSSVKAAVIAGIGIGVLPCLGSDDDARLVRLTPVLESWNNWVVTSEHARDNARIRAVKLGLVELIQEGTPALAGEAAP